MTLKTFAFIHPMTDEQLQPFRHALPDIEFLAPDGSALPPGVDRADAAAISWNAPPVDALLDAMPQLEWLHLRGAGIDKVVTPRLIASDVVLTNGSGNHAPNIAEHVLALMLAFARGLPALIRAQQARCWEPPRSGDVFELGGQTLALIGCGAIGSALAERAAALGMTVTGVRRSSASASPAPQGVVRVVGIDRIDAVLADADHVAITLPLTAETARLFSTERFAAMKRGAYVYNVGRGGTVDQDALLAALHDGRVAGAGLDVTDPEPLPADSPLWEEPNVVITAHSSGLTPRSFARYQDLLLDNLQRRARGEALRNLVDKRLGY